MNRRIDIRIVTPDGHRPYPEAVEAAFGMDIDYAVLQARCRRAGSRAGGVVVGALRGAANDTRLSDN